MAARRRVLSQTQAMAAYAARLAGLTPTDAWAAARVDEAINGATDVTGTVSATMRLPADEKMAAREKLCEPSGRLTMQLRGLEVVCTAEGAPFVAGGTLSVADLAVWRLFGWLSAGALDGIPSDYVATTCPGLKALYTTVDAHPKVAEWKALHPKHYAAAA